ncbi:hypothetical protein EYF80_044144 [Liparis tanakae]|uniref:Uncharacterized protein n=1 Tax=Liparis tanakae TaxID=230148 RepID=A0A4Z2FWM3_9TELE|nr:hypothetical protein EYF80_044144 [Liparis tanakae]
MLGSRPNSTAPFRMVRPTSCGMMMRLRPCSMFWTASCSREDSAKPPTRNRNLMSLTSGFSNKSAAGEEEGLDEEHALLPSLEAYEHISPCRMESDCGTIIPEIIHRIHLLWSRGVFHAVAPELLVVVDKGEGQVDIEGVGSIRGRRPLPRLKRNHQVHPGRRPLDLKLVNEILAKDLTQHLLKFIVNAEGAEGSAWEKTSDRE